MAAMKIFYKQKHLCLVITNSHGKGSIIERSIERTLGKYRSTARSTSPVKYFVANIF